MDLPPPTLVLGPALALALALAPACSRPSGPEPTGANVVLIVVDSLRRDHVSCYRDGPVTTPAIDALAAEGVRYENALSQSSWTAPSLGALMTSRVPDELGLRTVQAIVPADATLLSETLQANGYATGAVVSHKLCSSRWGFDQGFDTFDESNVIGHRGVSSPAVTDRALEFLAAREDDERPFFLWVHYFDPHLVYVDHGGVDGAGQDGAGQDGAGQDDTGRGYDGPVVHGLELAELLKLDLGRGDVAELRRQYRAEIAFTDRHVGRLLDGLRASGRYDDTLVVLTSDHGEEFLEHGTLGHGRTLHREVLEVPLIVKYPADHVPPADRTQLAALLDVAPTALTVAGLEPLAPLQGHVLGDAPEGRTIPAYTYHEGGMRSVTGPRFKLIRWTLTGEEQLYNVLRDPEERFDLLVRGPIGLAGAVRQRLYAELEAWSREADSLPDSFLHLDRAELDGLRRMGYTSGL